MKLRLSNISRIYGPFRALDGVTFEVEAINSLVLIGPSGGGKSTLLRIIAGLDTPDMGEVEVGGQLLEFREPAMREHRRTVGTVFQAFNLFPHLTALANITLPLVKVHGLPRAEAQEIAESLLKRFRLGAHAGKRPAELSGGQRQRVAIARALSIRPKLLLLDEPTSALDPEMTVEVLDMIRELRDEGRNLILVTHEMGFARRVADMVAVIADGKLAEFGPARQIFEEPHSEIARGFLQKLMHFA